MTCEQAFDRYLELDKNARVPLSVTIHLLFCRECRTGVRSLTRAEHLLAEPLVVDSPAVRIRQPVDPVVAAALARIQSAGIAYPELPPDERGVSLLRWFVAGIGLAAGFAVVPFSSIGSWSGSTFGNSFLVPFYLLCGVAVTLYCGLFVGTNIDLFVKRFGFRHTT
jgi:hypothetical protein